MFRCWGSEYRAKKKKKKNEIAPVVLSSHTVICLWMCMSPYHLWLHYVTCFFNQFYAFILQAVFASLCNRFKWWEKGVGSGELWAAVGSYDTNNNNVPLIISHLRVDYFEPSCVTGWWDHIDSYESQRLSTGMEPALRLSSDTGGRTGSGWVVTGLNSV